MKHVVITGGVLMNNNMQNQNQNQVQNQNQTQMQNQNQGALSSKNLTILEDQMSKEALNFKKMNLYADYCNDQQLKTVCQKAAQMHRKHFDTLYNYLNSHNRPAQMQ